MDWMIEVNGLVKTFGHLTAVDGVSFNVPKGQVLGFLGPNGAGKSTTMKMITGFMTPTAGRVRVVGHEVDEEPIAAKTQIGYLPEGAPAYPDMTPVVLPMPPDQAFEDALAAVNGMGWKVAGSNRGEGRIEATDTTFWFGFKDDVVIRLRPAVGGTQVDVRSVSRVGGGDVGANAKRIRSYLQRLQTR